MFLINELSIKRINRSYGTARTLRDWGATHQMSLQDKERSSGKIGYEIWSPISS